jgi:hypothetical protein
MSLIILQFGTEKSQRVWIPVTNARCVIASANAISFEIEIIQDIVVASSYCPQIFPRLKDSVFTMEMVGVK